METLKSQITTLQETMFKEIEDLEKQKKVLAVEIDKLKKEKAEFDVFPHRLELPRVILDVGGQLFSTTIETLTNVPNSLLGRMFSGRVPILPNEEGYFFIDRDGEHFRHILNFLRDPNHFEMKIIDKQTLLELRIEAQYYDLEEQMFKTPPVSDKDYNWLTNVSINSYSSQYSICPATNVLDPNASYWLSESGLTTNQYIVFAFKDTVVVNKLSIKVDYFQCSVKDFRVEVSEDDDLKTWNSVAEFQAKCGLDCRDLQNFEGFSVKTKYIRLYFLNNWGPGGGNYILVSKVKFWGAVIKE